MSREIVPSRYKGHRYPIRGQRPATGVPPKLFCIREERVLAVSRAGEQVPQSRPTPGDAAKKSSQCLAWRDGSVASSSRRYRTLCDPRRGWQRPHPHCVNAGIPDYVRMPSDSPYALAEALFLERWSRSFVATGWLVVNSGSRSPPRLGSPFVNHLLTSQ